MQQPVVSDAELEEAMRVVVDNAAETVPEDIPVRTVVRLGKPGDEIFTEANRGDYDLDRHGQPRARFLDLGPPR